MFGSLSRLAFGLLSLFWIVGGLGLRSAEAAFQITNPFSEVVEDVSGFVNSKLGPSDVGASYAALINFAGNPDISTATYYIDSGGQTTGTLTVGRFSFRKPLWEEGDSWRPFIQAFIPYETLKYDVDFEGEGEDADAQWDAIGLILTAGNEFAVSDRMKVTPGINFGAFQLESNAGFRGAISENIIDTTFSGRDFDWTAYAWVLGASVWLDYEWEHRTYDAGLHAGITYNHVESFYATEDRISFSSEAVTVALNYETVHDTPISLNDFPLKLVLSVGGSAFFGPAGNALGFSSFTDYGAAVKTDISRLGWPIQSLQLGGKLIFGPDVTGWSLILQYEF